MGYGCKKKESRSSKDLCSMGGGRCPGSGVGALDFLVLVVLVVLDASGKVDEPTPSRLLGGLHRTRLQRHRRERMDARMHTGRPRGKAKSN